MKSSKQTEVTGFEDQSSASTSNTVDLNKQREKTSDLEVRQGQSIRPEEVKQ